MINLNNDLIEELDKWHVAKRQALHRLERAEERVNTMEGHVVDSGFKYSNNSEEAAQAERKDLMRITSLKLSSKEGRDVTARVEKETYRKVGSRAISAERQKRQGILKRQLRENKKALGWIGVQLADVTGE